MTIENEILEKIGDLELYKDQLSNRLTHLCQLCKVLTLRLENPDIFAEGEDENMLSGNRIWKK